MESHTNPLEFLTAHEATMKPLMDSLGKGHFENLKTLAGAREVSRRVPLPGYIMEPEVKGFIEKVTGTSARGWIAALSPRTFATSTQDRVVNLGSRFLLRIKADKTKEFRDAALLNPDLTKVLAQIVKEGPTKERYLKVRDHLFSMGIRTSAVTSMNPGKEATPEDRESFIDRYKREHPEG